MKAVIIRYYIVVTITDAKCFIIVSHIGKMIKKKRYNITVLIDESFDFSQNGI